MRAMFGPSLFATIVLVAGTAMSTGPAAADPVVTGEEHCVINVASNDTLNIRKQPSSKSAIAAKKQYGDCGILITGACKGSWCPVEDGHSQGWAHRNYLAMVSPALYCVSGVDEDDTLNLRAFPSTSSSVLTELDPHQCDIAFLPYAKGSWQKVRVDGWQGWVSRKYVSGE